MDMYLLVAGLALVAGFLSGLLGIGGGIVMAPLLLYVPPLFGLAPLSMHVVAGLTIVQGLTACTSGVVAHHRFRCVSRGLTCWMGGTIFVTALIGGAAAGLVANEVLLLLIFALLALVAAVLIFVPVTNDSEHPDLDDFSFNRGRAVIAAGSVGLLGGMVGQGGSFILIPLMTSFVRVPTRIAIGSNLAIVFLSSLAAFLGKAVTGQIVWPLALVIAVTVIPAAQLGGRISRRVPVAGLRMLLAVCIGLAAVRIGISVVDSWRW
ncbi:MAG: sulfite exporter TauE/SafE family protein [Desulfobulbaceae bacterium]|nr:sulfite exporter TauE/SafE family protein [Desulfobulbaceae bacterium]